MAMITTTLLRGLSAAPLFAGLLAAQIPEQTVASVNGSRLGSMQFKDSKEIAAASATPSSSRRGGMLLAQIPPQPGISPGQNPNTIRPITPPGGSRNPRVGRPAGSPGPVSTPTLNGQPPASGLNGAPPPPRPMIAEQPQQPEAPVFSNDDGELIDLTMINVPMPQILLLYEELTGKKVIRDINVEAVTFTLETTGKLPKAKAIEYIEKSLLLNGYAFIPAGEDMVKFINVAALKVGPERPIIYSTDKLPTSGEAVVTYVQPLQFLDPEDLKKSLGELVPLHPYGVLTALPNSRGIVITENSNTIRYILELLVHMDVEPSRTEKRSFQLTRASAEDVAEALAEILDLEGKSKNGSTGGSNTTTPNIPQPNPGAIPNQPGAAVAASQTRTGVYGSAPQASAAPPKLVPIPRTNKLMVIARPVDLDYIGGLIEELDGAAELRNFVSRTLKYQNATDLLQLLGDALQRISDEGGSGSGSGSNGNIIGSNGNNSSNSNRTTGNFGSNNNSGGLGSNNSSFGSGSNGFGSGSGGGGSFGGGGGVESLRQNGPPQSLVLGKTLVIADPIQNEIFASGPPEHLETINQIIDELDTRPKSVMLSVVIGSLSIGDNKDWGIDYLFRPTEVRYNGVNGTVAGTSKNRVGLGQSITDTSTIDDLAGLAENIPSGVQFFGTIEDQVAVAISALSTNSDFKVLSRPTLYTMNNVPASIETGLKVPVPTSTQSSFSGGSVDPTTGNNTSGFISNIAYQDVQLRLDVAPLINSDDEITLKVKQVNADIAGSTTISGNSIPNISNQGLETTVMVKNNATVLLGGLITETLDKERGGIPGLRNLPVLKYIFGSMKEVKNRRELLVFIQPRIINGEGDMPVNYQDAPGASPLSDDMHRFMKQEKTDPSHDEKNIKRTKLGRLIQKLFN
jgi:type II secretion system protein D